MVSYRTTPANEDPGEDVALQERTLSLQGDAPTAMPLGVETCSGYEAATKSILVSEAPCASQEKPGQVESRQYFLPKSKYLWRLLLLPALMVYAALHALWTCKPAATWTCTSPTTARAPLWKIGLSCGAQPCRATFQMRGDQRRRLRAERERDHEFFFVEITLFSTLIPDPVRTLVAPIVENTWRACVEKRLEQILPPGSDQALLADCTVRS